jgi:hypothetical protein
MGTGEGNFDIITIVGVERSTDDVVVHESRVVDIELRRKRK